MAEICIISEQPNPVIVACGLEYEGYEEAISLSSTFAASITSSIWLKEVWKVPCGNAKANSPPLSDSTSQMWWWKVENMYSGTERERVETTVSRMKKLANIDSV